MNYMSLTEGCRGVCGQDECGLCSVTQNTELVRISAKITSQRKPWRTHSCVPRRDTSRRFFALENHASTRVSTRHARVRAPHGQSGKREVILAWSLSVPGRRGAAVP